MGSDLIRKLIVILLMAALAFMVGSNAADGRLRDAILPATCIAGGFVFLYLGRRCWWLIFLVPALHSFLPIQSIAGLPLAQLVTACVFVYWLLMSTMGYVTIKWRSLIWLDIPVFAFFLYFAYTYYLHPVSIGMLGGWDDGEVGGKDYVFMLLAATTYCAISLIPCSLSQLCRVVKWTLWASVVLTLVNTVKGGAQMGASGIAEGAAKSRFGLFSGLGSIGMMCLCGWNSPLRILCSPVKVLLSLILVFFVAMSGWREVLLSFGCFLFLWALAYRQLYVLVSFSTTALAGLYFLSSQDILLQAPFGVQRVLTPFPGLKLKKEIVEGARHSTEWRKEMWRWALNPRMGYIKDYVWGDGFGISTKDLRLTTINMGRGKMGGGNQEFFAETGTWHSGFILTIHRLGYVGLVFNALWCLASLGVVFRLCCQLAGKKEFPYALYATGSYLGTVVLFYISAGTYPAFFSSTVTIAIAKVFYVEALKEGLIPHLFTRKTYVPFMMRDEELRRLRMARKAGISVAATEKDRG